LISAAHVAECTKATRQVNSNVEEHEMKRTTVLAAIASAALGGLALLAGCSTTKVEPTKAVFYRTTPVLLDSEYEQPIQLALGAGDQIGAQVREAYLARVDGACRHRADRSVRRGHEFPRPVFRRLTETLADRLRSPISVGPVVGRSSG
jgi:hypothetical protein